MSIRDDLANLLRPWVTTGTTDIAAVRQVRPQPSLRVRTGEELADAVLDWLDPWLNEFRDEYVAGRAPAQHVWSIDAAIEQVRQAREESS